MKQLITYQKFLNLSTGEEFEVPVLHHDAKNADFEMIFSGHLLNILDDLGSKKIKVFQYIVKNRVGKSSGLCDKTITEIANETKISRQTVHDTLRYLEVKGYVKRKTGRIYLNPNVICDGRFKGKILHSYSQIGKTKEIEFPDDSEGMFQTEQVLEEANLN